MESFVYFNFKFCSGTSEPKIITKSWKHWEKSPSVPSKWLWQQLTRSHREVKQIHDDNSKTKSTLSRNFETLMDWTWAQGTKLLHKTYHQECLLWNIKLSFRILFQFTSLVRGASVLKRILSAPTYQIYFMNYLRQIKWKASLDPFIFIRYSKTFLKKPPNFKDQ